MPLRREMTQTEVDAAGFLPFGSASVAEICKRFRASGRWLLGLDGFMGSGKSPLASMFEFALGQECIRLDALLSPPAPNDQRSYLERIDAARLEGLLHRNRADDIRIVDGVLLQRILQGRVPRSEAFLVYVAGVWSPHPGEVVWPEGIRMENDFPSPIPLQAEIETYHRELHPHDTSDAIVLRDADQNDLAATLTSPNGRVFSIAADVVTQADVRHWRARTSAYTATNEPFAIEPLGLIKPPILGANTRGLNAERLVNVLRAMKNATPLPPVEVFRDSGAPLATLLDGTHRYFASVALGFTHIPCNLVSREEAELRYAFGR